MIGLKEKITNLFTKISSPALSVAVDWFTSNIWFLTRAKKVIFRKGRLESNRAEKDPVHALLQSGIEVGVTSYIAYYVKRPKWNDKNDLNRLVKQGHAVLICYRVMMHGNLVPKVSFRLAERLSEGCWMHECMVAIWVFQLSSQSWCKVLNPALLQEFLG